MARDSVTDHVTDYRQVITITFPVARQAWLVDDAGDTIGPFPAIAMTFSVGGEAIQYQGGEKETNPPRDAIDPLYWLEYAEHGRGKVLVLPDDYGSWETGWQPGKNVYFSEAAALAEAAARKGNTVARNGSHP